MTNSKQESLSKKRGSVSTGLLKVIAPIIAVSFILIILLLTSQARSIIIDFAKSDLYDAAGLNANRLGIEIAETKAYVDQTANTLESVSFADTNAMKEYLKTTTKFSENASGGVYACFEDNSHAFPAWDPEPGYAPTQKEWYKQINEFSTVDGIKPYLDAITNSMAVSFGRKITLPDGTKGVASIDMTLANVTKTVNELKPLDIGSSYLIDNRAILAYKDETLIGKNVDEAGNSFLKAAADFAAKNDESVQIMTGSSGKRSFVDATKVPGTSWTLISEVEEDKVLAKLNQFMIACYIMMVIIVVIICVLLIVLADKMITKPIKELTDQIVEISHGNFTVKMPKGKDNEIGLIQDEMRVYVDQMRDTISQIQITAGGLQKEAAASREASSNLTVEAKDQSSSMEQIRETMDGMSKAVTELANNATELAGAVSDLTERGHEASDTMSELVDKADVGKRDMSNVERNMTKITNEMTSMNDVIGNVAESAKKITGIVEMINSISTQTNLLSLNASIEAARAGEAGRGFAVVASEIGTLAGNSADASKEIENIINDITNQIENLAVQSKSNMEVITQSGTAVNTAGKSFEEIFTELNNTQTIVEQMMRMIDNVGETASSVAAISEEQSASSEEVTATTETLAESAQNVSAESEGVDKSAATVSESAELISQALNVFKI